MTKHLVMGIDPAIGPDMSTYVVGRKNGNGSMTILEFGRLQCRVVRSPARKRKLRKRGESIQWDVELGAWTWHMRRPS